MTNARDHARDPDCASIAFLVPFLHIVLTSQGSKHRPTARSRAGTKRALPRVLCIVGPTSGGKTKLGIELAKQFDGEIINADARQVYSGFDIGTGKPSDGSQGVYRRRKTFLVDGVPHELMDFLPPTRTFSVAEWRDETMKAIRRITARHHLPIVVGGTGLYIQALVDHYRIPEVPSQPAFRSAMESKTLDELVVSMMRLDPDAARVVDLKNRRRVLRALEVITFTGKPFSKQRTREEPDVEVLMIAPKHSREALHERINASVEKMIERGWIDEIRLLRDRGVAWNAPAMSSIGYRELGAYIRGETTLDLAIEQVKRATRQYAKRQMTWFRRDERIHWIADDSEAMTLVSRWLTQMD